MADFGIKGVSCTDGAISIVANGERSPVCAKRWSISRSWRDDSGRLVLEFRENINGSKFSAQSSGGTYRLTLPHNKETRHTTRFGLTKVVDVQWVGGLLAIVLPLKLEEYVKRKRKHKAKTKTPTPAPKSAVNIANQEISAPIVEDASPQVELLPLQSLVRELNTHKERLGEALTFEIGAETSLKPGKLIATVRFD